MAENVKKKKLLNGKDLFFLAMGSTIGAGIITNTGIAIGVAGSGVILAYLLAFIVTFVYNMPTLYFASVHPVASPQYVATSWMNKKLGGYWLYTQIFAALAQAYMGAAFGQYLSSITNINPTIGACIILTIFYLSNLFDMKTAAVIQNVTTAILLLTLLSFILLGLPKCNLGAMFSSQNFFYGGWGGIFNACAMVLFGVGGCTLLAQFGPEMENPRKNMPKITVLVFICAFLAFGLIAFVGSGVAPIEEVAGKPMTYQAQIIYPGKGYLIFVIGGALLAIITTINSNYARYWATVIRGVDEGWMPKVFSKRNRYGVPYVLLTLFYLMAIIPNLFGMNIGVLVSLASAITLIPTMIPLWGFVLLPERSPEDWAKGGKIAKAFSSKTSRIVLCLIATIAIGIFVIINIMNFTKTTLIGFVVYFVLTGIICFGFGDKILENGQKRLAENK